LQQKEKYFHLVLYGLLKRNGCLYKLMTEYLVSLFAKWLI
jgi:hypothetical protein